LLVYRYPVVFYAVLTTPFLPPSLTPSLQLYTLVTLVEVDTFKGLQNASVDE